MPLQDLNKLTMPRGKLKFVQAWVGHKNIQHTTRYAPLTNPIAMTRPASCLRITGRYEILGEQVFRDLEPSQTTVHVS
jgi:hypothetical protein